MKIFCLIILMFGYTLNFTAQTNESLFGDSAVMYESYDDETRGFQYLMKQNLNDGKWIIYWDSLRTIIAVEGFYKSQLKNGNFVYYYKNGVKNNATYWRNGKPSGKYEKYYQNGNLNVKGKYKSIKKRYCKGVCSRPVGKWKYWNEKGVLIKEEIWRKGILKETKEYDEEGNLIKK